jgi:Protein of unknown function (DUF3237)
MSYRGISGVSGVLIPAHYPESAVTQYGLSSTRSNGEKEEQRALTAGSSTDYGDQYFRTSPRFETGDPRYSWLNHTVFVAEGRILPHAVEYKVYRVT